VYIWPKKMVQKKYLIETSFSAYVNCQVVTSRLK
jgi:hypothetical protein